MGGRSWRRNPALLSWPGRWFCIAVSRDPMVIRDGCMGAYATVVVAVTVGLM